MNILKALVIIIIGICFIYYNYKDGKDREIDFTERSYIIHLGGYLAGVFSILLGIRMLLDIFFNI